MTLQQLFNLNRKLYQRRNRYFLSKLADKIAFLDIAMADLDRAIDLMLPLAALEVAIARVGMRILTLGNHYEHLPIVRFMAKKYPAHGCAYCQQKPCRCGIIKAADAQLDLPNTLHLQKTWTLSQWHDHLSAVYSGKNEGKSTSEIMHRLRKEIGEFSRLQLQLRYSGKTLDEIDQDFCLEFADTLAWFMAISERCKINPEAAILGRYAKGCVICQSLPCNCGPFALRQKSWKQYIVP